MLDENPKGIFQIIKFSNDILSFHCRMSGTNATVKFTLQPSEMEEYRERRKLLQQELERITSAPAGEINMEQLSNTTAEMAKVNEKLEEALTEANEIIESLSNTATQFNPALSSTSCQQNASSGSGVNHETSSISADQQSLQEILCESKMLNRQLLAIDPCDTIPGTSKIAPNIYNRWRRSFISVAQNKKEYEKVPFFLKSAGTALLDILDLCPETQSKGMPDSMSISEVLERLDKYFNSKSVKKLTRLEFHGLRQLPNESSMNFLDRVSSFATNCQFKAEKLNKEIMDVMARNSTDKEVRQRASGIDNGGNRFSSSHFKDILLHHEGFLANERANSRARQISAVNQVENGPARASSYFQPIGARSSNKRDPSRARPTQFLQQGLGVRRSPCTRCGSSMHSEGSCPNINKTCFKCQKVGHLQHMCRSSQAGKRNFPIQQEGQKGSAGNPKRARIANVEKDGPDTSEVGIGSGKEEENSSEDE